jgi:hypothetical protein
VEDLLLEAPSLLVGEVQDGPDGFRNHGVGVDGEVGALRVLQRTFQLFQLALDLLGGAAKSVEGLAGFGLGGGHDAPGHEDERAGGARHGTSRVEAWREARDAAMPHGA